MEWAIKPSHATVSLNSQYCTTIAMANKCNFSPTPSCRMRGYCRNTGFQGDPAQINQFLGGGGGGGRRGVTQFGGLISEPWVLDVLHFCLLAIAKRPNNLITNYFNFFYSNLPYLMANYGLKKRTKNLHEDTMIIIRLAWMNLRQDIRTDKKNMFGNFP